ncbi:hypothetical protein FOA52_004016 [Chlamydomonas sp. UWO 241]|nr:hypothetical protein FOA52_004016 [Chlamydomonas sp. UWO 241]
MADDFPMLDQLPEELLLQVFKHLCELGPSWADTDQPWFIRGLQYRNTDSDVQPHAGLRAYPFLGQVCKKWQNLLATPIARQMLWQQLVIDFGHELVTAIHMPLVWSNERPNSEEYTSAYHRISLSSSKVINFIMSCARNNSLTSLVLSNSEGFWGDDGDYLNLTGKHNFQASHMGYVLAELRNQLQELRLYNCNDLLNSDQGLWSLVARCPNMRVLAVEGLNCRVLTQHAVELSVLSSLESLSLIGEEHTGQWIVGLDTIPQQWSSLTALTKLELRGHHLLVSVPPWLSTLPSLRTLDLSGNNAVDLSSLPKFTQLEVLVLQNLDLGQPVVGTELVASQFVKRTLPDLSTLKNLKCVKRTLPDLSALEHLKALSLGGNRFTRLPECLVKMTALETIDFNGNKELQVLAPLTSLLAALPHIQVLDFRGVHKEKGTAYWSDAKCTTMKFLAAAAKLLKRRRYASRVIIDRD